MVAVLSVLSGVYHRFLIKFSSSWDSSLKLMIFSAILKPKSLYQNAKHSCVFCCSQAVRSQCIRTISHIGVSPTLCPPLCQFQPVPITHRCVVVGSNGCTAGPGHSAGQSHHHEVCDRLDWMILVVLPTLLILWFYFFCLAKIHILCFWAQDICKWFLPWATVSCSTALFSFSALITNEWNQSILCRLLVT